VAALEAGGCRIEPWPSWIEGFAAGPIVAEAEIALAAATTRRAAAILLDQRNGALMLDVADLGRQLHHSKLSVARSSLSALLARSALGQRLTQPWQVAIAGRPNVGKSSLINALVGYQRAIVFDQPGTTRDVLAAETAVDGWPVRLTDAAGIRATTDALEAEGVARARRQLEQADLVLWVIDVAALGVAGTEEVAAAVQRELRDPSVELGAAASPPLVVVNKIDLKPELLSTGGRNFVATSALTGAGLGSLLAAISQRIVPNPPPPGAAVPFTERQVGLLDRALELVARGDALAAAEALALLDARHPEDAG
jgi:tRNA modification GTPase